MRTKSDIAEALWPVARRRVLGLLLTDPDRELHLREISRRTELAPATVQREVLSLASAGILRRRREGRQVYYGADRACPVFPELQGLLLKTAGLADVLRRALEPLQDRVELAFVFGSVADGTATTTSDVDLMVIGEVSLRDLAAGLRQAREKLSREINAATIGPQDFAERVASGDHFLTSVLVQPKIFVLGEEDDLGRLA